MANSKRLAPLADRAPLRVLFLTTSMPIGGAETLLFNLVSRMDRDRCLPQIACLKELGPLGEQLARIVPAHSRFLQHKWDLRVLPRLYRHFRRQRIDAVITVGAGDKMFWGRLAARMAGIPVIASALHSTGWPDSVGRLNRWLTPITDAFIGVAAQHGRHLVEKERFPAEKVWVIPNGVDTNRFCRHRESGCTVRAELGIPLDAPVCGIVAALRPEKNHRVFLQAAARIRQELPEARFVIVGDGPERSGLEQFAGDLGVAAAVSFLGSRGDVERVLASLDLFLLTSDNEANPVSILEALSCEVPVVATRVGSVAATVIEGRTGYLAAPRQPDELAARAIRLLQDKALRRQFGQAGRQLVVDDWSLERMVLGYEAMICDIYSQKAAATLRSSARPADRLPVSAGQSRRRRL